MTTANRLRSEMAEAHRVRDYITGKLKTTVNKEYWTRRLDRQHARISALTDEQIRQEVRLAHE